MSIPTFSSVEVAGTYGSARKVDSKLEKYQILLPITDIDLSRFGNV
jgi:hypothetical protein